MDHGQFTEGLLTDGTELRYGSWCVSGHLSLSDDVQALQCRSQSLPGHQRHRWYHTFMEKTTLYLPDDLKSAIKRVATQQGVSEAEVIRRSIRKSIGEVRPRPRGGLFSSGHPIARQAEDLLPGFGER